jgi:hypothetical protein
MVAASVLASAVLILIFPVSTDTGVFAETGSALFAKAGDTARTEKHNSNVERVLTHSFTIDNIVTIPYVVGEKRHRPDDWLSVWRQVNTVDSYRVL